MASSPFGNIDIAQLAGLEPFPLTLVSDGDRSSAEITLDGELWPGGAYTYAFDFVAGLEYRLQTSPAEYGFAERAVLVERATGDIVWGSATAIADFGYAPEQAADLSDDPLTFDASGAYLLVLWSPPPEPGAEQGPTPFHIEAYVDAPVIPEPEVPPPEPPPPEPPPPEVTDNAVFRFFDTLRGIERLTASVELRDQLLAERPDLRYDGEAFVGDDQPREGWVPVFEVLDNESGRRYYTADAFERDMFVAGSQSAVDQGVVFYVPGVAGENTEPVYRIDNLDTGLSFITSNATERLYLLLQGDWSDEGIAFNAWVPPPPEPELPAPELAGLESPEIVVVGVAADEAAPLI